MHREGSSAQHQTALNASCSSVCREKTNSSNSLHFRWAVTAVCVYMTIVCPFYPFNLYSAKILNIFIIEQKPFGLFYTDISAWLGLEGSIAWPEVIRGDRILMISLPAWDWASFLDLLISFPGVFQINSVLFLNKINDLIWIIWITLGVNCRNNVT